MPRQTLLAACLFALAALPMAGGEAQAANIFEKGFWMEGPRYDSKLPPCERLLWDLSWNFAEKERTFWNSDLKIVHYTNVREIAYRPWQSGNIPRRYCTAQAHISDGKARTVNYSIIEDGGFAGFRDGVEFCVIGLDRNWAFNPFCRMARP